MADFADFRRRFAENNDINDLFSIIDGSPDRSGIASIRSEDTAETTLIDI